MHKILVPTEENLSISADLLANGELVAFPTETVYGLGGNAYDDSAIAKIFQYKNRPKFNPVTVCYRTLEEASNDVELNEKVITLAKNFLPGPVTVVLKRKSDSKLSWLCSAGLDTIGIRIPSHHTALNLLSLLSFPLAAPSANKSTTLSSTTALAVSESLSQNKDLTILDSGTSPIGVESTIIDLSSERARVLRVGAISVDEIIDKCKFPIDEFCLSPSSSIKHYQPNKELVLNAKTAEGNDALLAFGAPFPNNCKYVLNLSPNENLQEAASNFFSMLHELDKTEATRICVMPIPQNGIGKAINDRLGIRNFKK